MFQFHVPSHFHVKPMILSHFGKHHFIIVFSLPLNRVLTATTNDQNVVKSKSIIASTIIF